MARLDGSYSEPHRHISEHAIVRFPLTLLEGLLALQTACDGRVTIEEMRTNGLLTTHAKCITFLCKAQQGGLNAAEFHYVTIDFCQVDVDQQVNKLLFARISDAVSQPTVRFIIVLVWFTLNVPSQLVRADQQAVA